jgi:hypothetical protein
MAITPDTLDAELTSRTGKGNAVLNDALGKGYRAGEVVLIATYDEATPHVLPSFIAATHEGAARVIAEFECRSLPKERLGDMQVKAERQHATEFARLGGLGVTPAVVLFAFLSGMTQVRHAEGILHSSIKGSA